MTNYIPFTTPKAGIEEVSQQKIRVFFFFPPLLHAGIPCMVVLGFWQKENFQKKILG
ncbi:hypothetical protein P170DRAFT_431837 [Aspergillus steynii IBT 23096]|uniref:Uncharacterized protein n=1 Tax=Aspergillus steynii IBT 23096 TaxID=1392250 RepID=A0A2I2GMS8_9EURO|nr:uncharacterized protein P170DRAFT_431837 [Aspergillus steynii IBT 23096]PLB54201.1 hypothetical protein P170DRAFT_431837 [Aspergillus steynii IBT 23096]